MTKIESTIVLFSITLCWASSYIFIKDIPEGFSTYAYMALTSGTACLILGVIFRRLLKRMTRRTILYGTILALLITGNMLLEKFGLDILPASAASAFASSNIIFVPLFLTLAKKYPSRNQIAGILIILCGITVNSTYSMEGSSLAGALYMLGSCVMMSLYTIVAADYTKKENPMLLTVLQLGITSVIAFVLWFATEPAPLSGIEWSRSTISYILILAFFSKAYAYSMLMYAEKYANAITVTVVAATEPIVTLLLAILIPNEEGMKEMFSARPLIGALIIAVGAVVAGTDFLTKKKALPETQASAAEVSAMEVAAAEAAAVETAASEGSAPEASSLEASGQAPEVHGTPKQAAPASVIRSLPKPLRRIVRLRYLSVFVVTACVFAILGVSIELIDLSDGYTNVRPENAIPAVAGLLFGPIGAAACAVGNFIADQFLDFGWTSLLGIIGNFLAAFIPYRIWYAISDEKPNTHSLKGLLLFAVSICSGNLVCAWFLSSGLGLFFGEWYDYLMSEIFFNNLFFSFAFGLPFLIVLTSESKEGKWFTPHVLMPPLGKSAETNPLMKALAKPYMPLVLTIADITVLIIIMLANDNDILLKNSPAIMALSILAAILTAGICALPPVKVSQGDAASDSVESRGRSI